MTMLIALWLMGAAGTYGAMLLSLRVTDQQQRRPLLSLFRQ
jgi:hypothetical protein